MSPTQSSADVGHGATHSARLLISCPDGPGIVAAVGSFLVDHEANIVTSAQYSTHPAHGSFFMRVAFYLDGLAEDTERRATFESEFAELADRFEMTWRISYPGEPKRAFVMASREDHCLADLLWRHRRGELDMDLLGVISNHEDFRADVEALGIPYHHVRSRVTPSPSPSAGSWRSSAAAPTSSYSPDTCRSCPASSCAGSAVR